MPCYSLYLDKKNHISLALGYVLEKIVDQIAIV
jgi:hypothetical protein